MKPRTIRNRKRDCDQHYLTKIFRLQSMNQSGERNKRLAIADVCLDFLVGGLITEQPRTPYLCLFTTVLGLESFFQKVLGLSRQCNPAGWELKTNKPWPVIRQLVKVKGAVSRYSVIFCAFFVQAKNGDCSRKCRGYQTVSRANSFTAPAESKKCRFPRAIVFFRGLTLWPPLFFPTQNGCQKSPILVTLPL